jgi:hypothetical protein
MKKIINNPKNVVAELIEGLVHRACLYVVLLQEIREQHRVVP